MKTYKILSVVFIVICLLLMAGVLFFMDGGQTTHKIVLVACLAVVIFAMVYNLRIIRKKQKQAGDQ